MKKINYIKLGFIITGFFIGTHSVSAATFEERCAEQGVVFCYGFDDLSDMEKGFYAAGDPSRCSDGVCKTMDATTKVSGLGSLRMEIPSNTGANTSGGWRRNFSDDLSVQFAEVKGSNLLMTNYCNSSKIFTHVTSSSNRVLWCRLSCHEPGQCLSENIYQ